jgi:nicotinamidase-related amidase
MKKFPEMFAYYFERMDNLVVPNTERLLKYFRENTLQVVHLTFGPQVEDGRDQIPRRKRRDKIMTDETGINVTVSKDTEAHKIHPRLEPIKGELVVNKNSNSPFNSSGIDQFLRNMEITGLVMAGVVTTGCVESTLRDASDKGYECVLVEDACGGFDQQSHEATMRAVARTFGEVWTTDETVTNLNRLFS